MPNTLRDIAPYNEMGEPLAHVYLEYLGPNDKNASGQSNKYWECAVFVDKSTKDTSYLIVRRWGRYGSKGQTKVERDYSNRYAVELCHGYAREKRGKGYTKEIDVVTRLGLLVKGDA